jgi:hypothetical protein
MFALSRASAPDSIANSTPPSSPRTRPSTVTERAKPVMLTDAPYLSPSNTWPALQPEPGSAASTRQHVRPTGPKWSSPKS